MDITAPGGFRLQRDTAITIRPARPPASLVSGAEMAAGAEARLDPPTSRFMPGTWSAEAVFGAPVRYDVAALVRALEAYPLSCLEQTVSRGLPLALLPDGPVAGDQRAARLGAAVASVLDRQRYDGGFGLWSANGEAEAWLSSYAVEFLLRARAAGATVPDVALAEALSRKGWRPRPIACTCWQWPGRAVRGARGCLPRIPARFRRRWRARMWPRPWRWRMTSRVPRRCFAPHSTAPPGAGGRPTTAADCATSPRWRCC